jgi:hypothetical protein
MLFSKLKFSANTVIPGVSALRLACSQTYSFRNSEIGEVRLFVLWGLAGGLHLPFWNRV